jgi:hypothetical protein
MPAPDVVLEIAVNADIDKGQLPRILATVRSLMLSAVPLGPAARAAALFADRAGFAVPVLSVGVWADAEGNSEARLEAALASAGQLMPGRGAALSFTAHAIQVMASLAWRDVNKKVDLPLGFLRLSDDLRVTIADGRIVTTVTGVHKVRLLPNTPFKVTIFERLGVDRTGAGSPIVVAETTRRREFGSLKLAALVSFVNPALGALVFWQGSNLADRTIPESTDGGAGSTLATQWPSEILTEIAPPILPGKFLLIWTEISVSEMGVVTRGAILPSARAPQVQIAGPGSITLHQPHGSTTETYEAVFEDLRQPLRRLRWIIDGANAGRGRTQSVRFGNPHLVDPPPESRMLRVEVTDADELTTAHDRTVRFKVIPAPGHPPF